MRVYLTNVEGICRRFVDEKRESLQRMKETTASFKAYWASMSANEKKALVQHKGSDMLKVGFTLPQPDSLSCQWRYFISSSTYASMLLHSGGLVSQTAKQDLVRRTSQSSSVLLQRLHQQQCMQACIHPACRCGMQSQTDASSCSRYSVSIPCCIIANAHKLMCCCSHAWYAAVFDIEIHFKEPLLCFYLLAISAVAASAGLQHFRQSRFHRSAISVTSRTRYALHSGNCTHAPTCSMVQQHHWQQSVHPSAVA